MKSNKKLTLERNEVCPECTSWNLIYEDYKGILNVGVFFECKDCGYRWYDE